VASNKWFFGIKLAGILRSGKNSGRYLHILLVLPAAAAVTVYAEGAYTDSDLVVYIYADITTDAICSAGVKLSYNNTVLTVASAEKNDAVWFMGAGAPGHPYMNPEDAGDGVIVICGKLDTNNPTVGVIGDRVLLGKVSFNIVGAPITTPVTDPEGFFGISVGLGRDEPFANFVTTGGVELDADAEPVAFTGATVRERGDAAEPVAFTGATVRERGDANADGYITNSDFIAVRNFMNANLYCVYGDCNNDTYITNSDFICIRNKM